MHSCVPVSKTTPEAERIPSGFTGLRTAGNKGQSLTEPEPYASFKDRYATISKTTPEAERIPSGFMSLGNAGFTNTLKKPYLLFAKLKEIEQVSTLIPKEQSSTSINASCRMNSDDAPEQIVSQRDNIPISDISDNTSNSDIHQESKTQFSTSPIHTEPISLEDKEIDEFLDSTYKERVSKEIIQSIKEKKFRDQELSSISVEESCSEKVRPKVPLEQNSKSAPIQKDISNLTKLSECKVRQVQALPEETKVSHDYIVVQDFIQEVSSGESEKVRPKVPLKQNGVVNHVSNTESTNIISRADTTKKTSLIAQISASPEEKGYQVLSEKINNPENRKNSKNNTLNLFLLKKMLSKEKHKEVINKLTMHFTDSPKVDLYCSVDKEGEHQTDSYWILGSHCPLCRKNHISLQDKWWLDNQGNKFYYLYCDNIKDPGIPFDEVLEAYPENSKLIQELKTQSFTLPIP
ncbi:18472_t:CDS:2 [Gigaspora margarita]|uniref:18472_t:CDS:1 n=1 Tax=Gigaspora margarita TaxID=4874 RepID=A0ABM8W643_GIGMA|nr:18472_t:CDS:2 [Gigaspora margarita]